MKKILTSWLFFLSLALFLMVSTTVLPGLLGDFFGRTEQKIEETVTDLQSEAIAVWSEITP